ncbi:16S rRNA (guanine(527)-N(7))-methyltransferase RsmG [Fontimonas sp. SYSU GA230001]|uniref:16S rRNA (guanine(527)-N(7))-methyltransferase RsmG n=1 Tax=Fontimonas sp. SYSU GA230001 TaxID=3142450 RepID=UPI0032B371AE
MSVHRSAPASATGAHALRARLETGCAKLGIALPAAAFDRLLAYLAELQKWNAAYNLTAVRDPADMVTRHLLDSLTVLPWIHGRVLDVGAGAGLPGLVLAIAAPTLQVTVLDSNGKKARFMRHAVRTLGLANVAVVEGRVEEFAAPDGFDCIVSRAFSALDDFFRLTRHLLAPGGQWIAMKGKLDAGELAAVSAGVVIQHVHRLTVPGLAEERHAVVAAPLQIEP